MLNYVSVLINTANKCLCSDVKCGIKSDSIVPKQVVSPS